MLANLDVQVRTSYQGRWRMFHWRVGRWADMTWDGELRQPGFDEKLADELTYIPVNM